MHKIFKIGQMLHVPAALLLFALVAVPVWRTTGSIGLAILKSLPFCFSIMGCFAINDYCDVAKDKISKPYRAIPSGAIDAKSALCIGVTLEVLGFISAFFCAEGMLEWTLYVSLTAGSVLYSVFLKAIGLLKGVYTAVFLAIPFLFSALYSAGVKDVLLYIASVILFITGKELYMDVRDKEGDKAAGYSTLPIIIGEKISITIVVLLEVVAVIFLGFSSKNGLFSIMAIMVLALLLCLYLNRHKVSWAFRASIYGMWVPLVVCVFPLVAF